MAADPFPATNSKQLVLLLAVGVPRNVAKLPLEGGSWPHFHGNLQWWEAVKFSVFTRFQQLTCFCLASTYTISRTTQYHNLWAENRKISTLGLMA